MTNTLYRIEERHQDQKEKAFWVIGIPHWADASIHERGDHRVIVEMELTTLDVYGSILGERYIPPSGNPTDGLVSVGNFQNMRQFLDIITPTLMEMATFRLTQFFRNGDHVHSAIEKHLNRSPYENACWILKSSPDELQSWASTIANRPS
jgi:hypothetical protein